MSRFDPFTPKTGLAAPVASAPSATPWGPIALGVLGVGLVGLYLYSRRAGEAPILIKGRNVRLITTDNRTISSPFSYGMIHDPTGTQLPKRYVFIGPFRRSRTPVELDANGVAYFGHDYEAVGAVVDVPSGPWKRVGDVQQIIYDRDRGYYAERRPYEHTFRSPIPVSKCGQFKRLEMPLGSRVNWRGFVAP